MSGIPRMGGMSHMNGNNRRPPNLNRLPPSNDKPSSSQHDEIIKFVYDSWNKVSQEVDQSRGNNSSVVFYQEQENRNLKNFEPFDLEAYWGRRVVQNVHQSQHL